MQHINKITTIIFVVLFSTISVFAQKEIFDLTNKQQLVIDNAQEFTKNEHKALTQKLNKFSNETSTQILVYTTTDLKGYDVGDYAQRLGEELKVGQKGFDNGIVVLFKPKTTNSRGQIWISVGYGIEPLIPDATANQIVENEMIPYFKKGEVFSGINAGIDVCISLTKKEFTASDYGESKKSSGGGLFFIIVFIIVFSSIFGKSRSSRNYSTGSRSNLPLWTALFLMGSGSNHGSGFSNFSSGSGSFGGGGFGGFGGGSFGGGGAGGSW